MVKPELEVIIRTANVEIAVVAIFREEDDTLNILCGIADPSDRHALANLLELAGEAVREALYSQSTLGGRFDMDESNGSSEEGKDGYGAEPPLPF